MRMITTKSRKAIASLWDYSDELRPIRKQTLESMKRKSAKYIFVKDKLGSAECERCHSALFLDKTKHKEKYICPNCKAKLEISHDWRATRKEDRYTWYVIPRVVDTNCLVLRYVLVARDRSSVFCAELARYIANYDTRQELFLEDDAYWSDIKAGNSNWKRLTRNYFREHGMSYYQYRRICCLGAELWNNGCDELNKLAAFKYFKVKDEYFKHSYVSGAMNWLTKRAELYEKLQKANLEKLISADLDSWVSDMIAYNSSATKLWDALLITKSQLAIIQQTQNKKLLDYFAQARSLKELKLNISDEDLELAFEAGINIHNLTAILSGKEPIKLLHYLANNKVDYYEYIHYKDLLLKLEYPLDSMYLYPKNFRKMDQVISDAYKEKQKYIAEHKSEMIKAISDGLKKMPGLQKYLNGSKGLLISVPESNDDLVNEGAKLHNCIGTYGEKIASNQRLVFFVRKLNAPTEPFVAFEYFNGSVVQCRYDKNVDVKSQHTKESDNVIQFVNEFTDELRKNKVLLAA